MSLEPLERCPRSDDRWFMTRKLKYPYKPATVEKATTVQSPLTLPATHHYPLYQHRRCAGGCRLRHDLRGSRPLPKPRCQTA
jgi:hypothetical protein